MDVAKDLKIQFASNPVEGLDWVKSDWPYWDMIQPEYVRLGSMQPNSPDIPASSQGEKRKKLGDHTDKNGLNASRNKPLAPKKPSSRIKKKGKNSRDKPRGTESDESGDESGNSPDAPPRKKGRSGPSDMRLFDREPEVIFKSRQYRYMSYMDCAYKIDLTIEVSRHN